MPFWQDEGMDHEQDDYLQSTLGTIGPKLRGMRRHRKATLFELAQKSGISESTLSRLESGQRQPTLEHLLVLSRIYRVPVDELIGAPATGDPRVHLKPVTQYGMTWIPLTKRPGGIQAHKVVIPPADPHTVPKLATHEGYEWLYILNGSVRLILGDQDLVLNPGEAAEFDTHTPHWFNAAGTAPAELIILFGQQGERAHLRARSRTSTETSTDRG